VTFNSLQYAAFLPVVLVVYWTLRRREQNLLILAASYAFYSFWDWRFLGLLLLSTTVDYWTGRFLARREDDDRQRRLILSVSIVTNLGILGFFKYYGFFVDSAQRFLDRLGLDVSPPLLRVLLPVGISFYTFHGMSYTIDLFRRRIEPATSFVDFAAFVAFFPQLVAGPIGRADFQLPQFQRERSRPDAERVLGSLGLILLGLFKKVAIADAVAPVASAAFNDAGGRSWSALLIGAYAFALQIYGDFSGYTDMARGSARLLGFELPPNFEQPYLSASITEFWRRWHISLSSWLRDYLYVPLGGNRGSSARTYRNLFLVMLIGGLWHGAAWTFVVWGGLHGVALALHKWWGDRPGRARERRVPTWHRAVAARLATFHLVVALWVFFRAPGLGAAWEYLRRVATFAGGASPRWDDVLLVGAALVATLVIDVGQRRARDERLLVQLAPAVQGVAVGVLALGVVVFSRQATGGKLNCAHVK
jgi:D-alanyl-lipoteichoic acid acyltransferase DltB (MBOAT superfamily)